MANNGIPYLCCGTFLVQVLRARGDLCTSADHKDGIKESLSEQETLRRLVSVFRLSDFAPAGGTLKTYTTYVKKCTDSHESYFGFSDYDLRRSFDEDVRSDASKALYMMSGFVEEFIEPDKYEQLVRCLIGLINDDEDILPGDVLYIKEGGRSVAKSELLSEECYHIEAFLTGVWHYIIMNRHGDNEKGAETYEQWFKGRDNYVGQAGENITKKLEVISVPAEEPVQQEAAPEAVCAGDDDADEETVSGNQGCDTENTQEGEKHAAQYIGKATLVNQYGENNVHIDHVDILNL